MLRFNLCFSARKAQRMQDRKKAVKRISLAFKDGLYLFICLLVVAGIFNRIDIKFKSDANVVQAKEIQVVETIKEVKVVDERVIKLQTFLKSKNSPMADYAELIVSEADRNDIGWTWITGISCMESACGLRLPWNSYNAWGLGGSKFMYFKSWEESIKFMSELIGKNYRHDMLQGIKSRYCPESDGCRSSWSSIVASASKEILAK